MTNNIPKIRFKGFNDKWEFNILNDLCSLITKQTGFDYSPTIKPSLVVEENKESYPFIQNNDFNALNINLHTDFYIPKKIAQLFPKITIDTPSILISISGKIGNVGFYDLNKVAFIGGAVGICKLKKSSNGLIVLYNLLSNNGQKYFASLIKASSHSNITVEDIRKVNLYLPSSNSKESEKIGNFFKNIDKLITTNEQKLEKLKNIKTALLEKMFPQNNETTPKIRFKCFSDNWKKYKLGKIGNIITGSTPSTSQEDYYSADGIPWVTPTDISENIIYDTPRKLSKKGQMVARVVPKNTILVTCIASIGKNVMLGTTGSFNQQINGLVFDCEEFIPYFLFTESVLWSEKMKKSAAAGTMQIVNKTEFSELETMIPDSKEQISIGKMFEKFDRLITLHQQKIEKLKNIKSGLLEKMFV